MRILYTCKRRGPILERAAVVERAAAVEQLIGQVELAVDLRASPSGTPLAEFLCNNSRARMVGLNIFSKGVC